MMDFSLLNAVRNLPQAAYDLKDVYGDYISDGVLAEELGFKGSFYGEHHFRECQWSGSPMIVATAVAAKTQRLRVGTAVLLLPFHDPRRVAEDVAAVDIISGGRFDFGIGPGSQYEEFRTFGVDPAEMNGRMWESIDWIRRACRWRRCRWPASPTPPIGRGRSPDPGSSTSSTSTTCARTSTVTLRRTRRSPKR